MLEARRRPRPRSFPDSDLAMDVAALLLSLSLEGLIVTRIQEVVHGLDLFVDECIMSGA